MVEEFVNAVHAPKPSLPEARHLLRHRLPAAHTGLPLMTAQKQHEMCTAGMHRSTHWCVRAALRLTSKTRMGV